MNDIDTIKPGFGLGGLLFGSTRECCKKYLGEPEESVLSEIGDENTNIWYYWDKGISLYFDEDDDYKLGTIIIERETSKLFNGRQIGKSHREIESELKRRGYVIKKDVDYKDDDGSIHDSIEVDALQCNFLFVDLILKRIQWGYYWIDDETPKWPMNIV